MLFAKLAAVATFALSAFAAPLSIDANVNGGVLVSATASTKDILVKLQADVKPTLDRINALTVNGIVGLKADVVANVVAGLTGPLGVASGALLNLNVHVDLGVKAKRDVGVDDVTELASHVLADVITTVNKLKGAPGFDTLLPTIEGSLAHLLGSLNGVLGGVLALVGRLVGGVVLILKELGLRGVLHLLNL